VTDKYVLTEESQTVGNVTLHRIRALRQVRPGVDKGALGGWVESEVNLSQEGSAWVYGDALVYGSARLSKAWVYREVAPGVCVLLPPEARP
jgi:hypothetical protein